MILITGTGHSGSSYLVKLLEELGYSYIPEGMGYTDKDEPLELLREGRILKALQEGKEIQWPDVVKHLGGFCYNLSYHIDRFNWQVDHVYITMRSLSEGVEVFSHKSSYKKLYGSSEEIKAKLIDQIGNCIYGIIEKDLPFTIVRWPRLGTDSNYCVRKLQNLSSAEEILKAWSKVTKFDRINNWRNECEF